MDSALEEEGGGGGKYRGVGDAGRAKLAVDLEQHNLRPRANASITMPLQSSRHSATFSIVGDVRQTCTSPLVSEEPHISPSEPAIRLVLRREVSAAGARIPQHKPGPLLDVFDGRSSSGGGTEAPRCVRALVRVCVCLLARRGYGRAGGYKWERMRCTAWQAGESEGA